MSIYLYILGQMLYMEEWKMIVFLGTPQMNDLDAILNTHMESTKEHAHESWENEPTEYQFWRTITIVISYILIYLFAFIYLSVTLSFIHK